MLATALFVLTVAPEPVSLDSITVERARALHGRWVVADFLVATPSYTWRNQTIVGADIRDDGVERGAHLRGRRFDIDTGQRVTVAGKLRVLDHEACYVGGVFVPAWTELRVEEVK